MLLRRFLTHFRRQDWIAICLDFVIVVVGIFVGLQVNQWNEDRKDRQLELQYLASLKLDFESDIEELDNAIALAQMRSRLFRQIHEAVDTGRIEGDSTEFVWAVFNSMLLNYPSYTRTTVNDLMSTGNLQLIRDANVKRQIASYYREISYREQWMPNWRANQIALEHSIPDLLAFELRDEFQGTYRKGRPFHLGVHDIDPAIADQVLEKIRSHPEADGQIRNMTRIQDLHDTNLTEIREKAVYLVALLDSALEGDTDDSVDRLP